MLSVGDFVRLSDYTKRQSLGIIIQSNIKNEYSTTVRVKWLIINICYTYGELFFCEYKNINDLVKINV